jgi:hypothetical protein
MDAVELRENQLADAVVLEAEGVRLRWLIGAFVVV